MSQNYMYFINCSLDNIKVKLVGERRVTTDLFMISRNDTNVGVDFGNTLLHSPVTVMVAVRNCASGSRPASAAA